MTSPWMKITISNQKFHPCTKEIETLIDKDEQSKIYEIFFQNVSEKLEAQVNHIKATTLNTNGQNH